MLEIDTMKRFHIVILHIQLCNFVGEESVLTYLLAQIWFLPLLFISI